MDAKVYATHDLLRDGAPIWVRAIRSGDKQLLSRFHGRLSPGSPRWRLPPMPRSSEWPGTTFCRARGRGVRAEPGIVVEDSCQNRGVGTVLLKHLLGIAHDQGVDEITRGPQSPSSALFQDGDHWATDKLADGVRVVARSR